MKGRRRRKRGLVVTEKLMRDRVRDEEAGNGTGHKGMQRTNHRARQGSPRLDEIRGCYQDGAKGSIMSTETLPEMEEWKRKKGRKGMMAGLARTLQL